MFWNKKVSGNINTFDSSESVDLILIREKYNEYTKMFFGENGIPVTYYFEDIEQAELQMFTGGDKVRLVVVEEGLGDFTTMKNRKNINSILGICDGEKKRALVFYANSVIVSDNKSIKHTDFRKFYNTQDIIETLKEMGETYNGMDELTLDISEKIKDALGFKGEFAEVDDITDANDYNVQIDSILTNGEMKGLEDPLVAFEIKQI